MRPLSLFVLCVAFLAACGGGYDIVDPMVSQPIPLPEDGKTDNYISTNAREYVLTGTAHAPLSEGFDALDDAAKEAAIKSVVDRRLARVVTSAKSAIQDLLRPHNEGVTGEKANWFIYLKRGAGQAAQSELTTDGQVRFNFELELIGSVYLMSKVAPQEGSERAFTVAVGEYQGDPAAEQVEITIRGTESQDAFPRYNELFEDGVFDLAIHVGGDYNTERLDIDTAKWVVETLLEGGWTNPMVQSFDDLKIDSPPFVRTVTVEGRSIEVRVKLVHSDMVTPEEEEKLGASMRESLASYDVVFYSGHAGSNAGFILDYQPRYEIKAAEFETLELPSKYQIFVFDGCRTYRTYVDDMMKNPAKTWDNLDIVTTVNTTPFSAGYYVIWEFLHWFTLSSQDGRHFPLSWKTILRGVNRRSFKSVHYGVHGVDSNPRLNPHGSDGIACKPCETDMDCGAGGNLCLGYRVGGAACGVACTTDSACPDGYRCARLVDDPDLFYLPKQCVRRDFICQ